MLSQKGLRYRGTNQQIKEELARQKINQDEERNFLSIISSDESQSFLAHARFAEPPKEAKVSYAYGIEPTFLNEIKKQAPELSLKNIKDFYETTINLLKQTPAALKNLYDTASIEERKFVQAIASQVKEHYLTQLAISTVGSNPLLYAIILALYRISPVAAQFSNTATYNTTSSPFSFFNSFPPNGIDLCMHSLANLCNQFYVSQDNKTIIQGASYLTSTSQSVSNAKRVAGPCGDVDYLKSFLQDWLENQNETAVGNNTCTTSTYSLGRTIHLDNQLTNVSDKICSSLTHNSDSVITPCVQNAVHKAFDSSSSSSHPPKQSTSIPIFLYLLPVYAILLIIIPLVVVAVRRRNEARRAGSYHHL